MTATELALIHETASTLYDVAKRGADGLLDLEGEVARGERSVALLEGARRAHEANMLMLFSSACLGDEELAQAAVEEFRRRWERERFLSGRRGLHLVKG